MESKESENLCHDHYCFWNHIKVLEHEIHSGWPFGLEIVNVRLLRVGESSETAPLVEEPYPNSFHSVPSSNFSSFSSSNLDTESTASFFQDHSMSLGKLMGLRPGDHRGRGHLYFTSSLHLDRQRENVVMPVKSVCRSDVSKRHDSEMSQGICIPLLVAAVERIGRSRRKGS